MISRAYKKPTFDELTWPISRLHEALVALARQAKLSGPVDDLPQPPAALLLEDHDEPLRQWLTHVAGMLACEIESVDLTVADTDKLCRTMGPVLLHLSAQGPPRLLLILKSRSRRVAIVAPDLRVHWVDIVSLHAAVWREYGEALDVELTPVLGDAGISADKWTRMRNTLVRERFGQQPIGKGWRLRLPQQARWWQHLRQAHILNHFGIAISAHLLFYVIFIVSWWIIASHALQGSVDSAWLYGWAGLLVILVPLRVVAVHAQGRLTVGLSNLLKQRLLMGALRLDPDRIRHMGAGQLIGTILESEAVEAFFLNGGFSLIVLALVKLTLAACIMGATSIMHLSALLGFFTLTMLVSWVYFQRCRAWTATRIQMTHALVERMLGQRTRLVQESRAHWHDNEDRELQGYLHLSQALDRSGAWLMACVPRTWLLLALLIFAPSLVYTETSVAMLAASLGSILLAYQGLGGLTKGLPHLMGSLISWTSITPFFRAPSTAPCSGAPSVRRNPSTVAQAGEAQQPLLTAHNIAFWYPGHSEPVLHQCDLHISPHERLLLEGPSGGGKSTLVKLLTGLHQPASGEMLLQGLNWQTLGAEGWRQQAIAAPQFHENQIFTGTVLFNLLMGRRWPPRPEDVQEAKAICHELGLGPLLERMPAGLHQMVGETGWQLSHGERSRLYIARALLQKPALIILDESFGVLDPASLHTAMECVFSRASTLMVIAHP